MSNPAQALASLEAEAAELQAQLSQSSQRFISAVPVTARVPQAPVARSTKKPSR